MMKFRFRWSDARDAQASEYDNWRLPALIVATAFLSPVFVSGFATFPTSWGPSACFGGGLALACALLGLFYLGPAMMVRSARRPLFDVAECSFGAAAAVLFRLGCILYLTVLAATWLSTITFLTSRHGLPPLWTRLLGGVAALYLFSTSVQGLRTSSRLAFFTNRLSLAIIVAALIRARSGWAEAWPWWVAQPGDWTIQDIVQYAGMRILYGAPVAFLAVLFAHRVESRRHAALLGICGIAIPVLGAVLVGGFSVGVVINSDLGIVKMASLTHALLKAPREYNLIVRLLLALTLFGIVRFSAMGLAAAIPIAAEKTWIRGGVLTALACAAAVLAAIREFDGFAAQSHAAVLPVTAAAVLSADFMAGQWKRLNSRKVDWVGVTAWLAGAGVPYYRDLSFILTGAHFGPDLRDWGQPWIFPAYGTSFVVCAAGRLIERHWRPVQLKSGEDLGV